MVAALNCTKNVPPDRGTDKPRENQRENLRQSHKQVRQIRSHAALTVGSGNDKPAAASLSGHRKHPKDGLFRMLTIKQMLPFYYKESRE